MEKFTLEMFGETLSRIVALEMRINHFEWEQTQRPEHASSGERSVQAAGVQAELQSIFSDPKLRDSLQSLLDSGTVECSRALRNIELILRKIVRILRLPNNFCEQKSVAVNQAMASWSEALRVGSVNVVFPALERIFELSRIEAESVGYAAHPYDALLSEFEPGMTYAGIGALGKQFEKLARDIHERQVATVVPSLETGSQRIAVAEFLAERLKLPLSRIHLEESKFFWVSVCGAKDVRIGLDTNERNLRKFVAGILHELGHVAYELQMSTEFFGLPAYRAPSQGAHEMVALLFERTLIRDETLWADLLSRFSPDAKISPRDFSSSGGLNLTPIRIDADEVSYPLHLLVRLDIEARLISGDLQVTDIPEVWNEQYQKWLGIKPERVEDGFLQEASWFFGTVGYFVSYLFGSLAASQLTMTYRGKLNGWPASADLLPWCERNIFAQGGMLNTADLLQQLAGRPLSAVAHLELAQLVFGLP